MKKRKLIITMLTGLCVFLAGASLLSACKDDEESSIFINSSVAESGLSSESISSSEVISVEPSSETASSSEEASVENSSEFSSDEDSSVESSEEISSSEESSAIDSTSDEESSEIASSSEELSVDSSEKNSSSDESSSFDSVSSEDTSEFDDSSEESSVESSSEDVSSSEDSSADLSEDSSSSTNPAPHEHDFTKEVIEDTYLKTSATCESKAVYYYVCECGAQGETTFEYGSTLGHDTIPHDAQAATCLAIGWNAYETCSRCEYTTYVELPSTGHSFVTYVEDLEEDGTSKGTKTAVCENGCTQTDVQLIEYTATFAADGVTIDTQTYTIETEALINPAIPEKAGYTSAWPEYQLITEDITISANYTVITYTITYVLNESVNHQDNPDTYTVESEQVYLQSPTKGYGCQFYGWYTSENFEEGSEVYSIETGTYGDITLYAKWLSYRIENMEGFTVDYEQTCPTITMVVPYTTNYIDLNATFKVSKDCTWKLYKDFIGDHEWNLKSMSLTLGDNIAYLIVSHPNGQNHTRYVLNVYRLDMKSYAFVDQGYIYEDMQGEIEENSTLQEPATHPEYDGYEFVGWYIGEDQVTFPYVVTEDVVIEAGFSPIVYTVTFDPNGGSVEKESDTYTIETGLDFEYPVREHYDFLGWYFKGEPEEEQEGCIGLEIGSFGDFEVYAKWAPTTYYITYVLNGGENAEENPAKYNIETPDFYFASPKDRPGYTFDGWYLDESFTEESYLEGVATGNFGDFEVYAKWTVHTDTKYTVIYYWQNIEDDNYTPHESIELTGTTDTPTAEVEIKEYEHFSYNASKSVTSGNIDGDGSRVLSVYYTRNTYSLSIDNSDIGAITNSGTYKYGKEITTEETPYLGYEFIGWYCGEDLLSTDTSYTFTVDKNVTAKFEVKEEMSNFNFASTETTCSISGVKNKSVTNIVIPDSVTSIGNSAFKDCSKLTEMTLPFVGASKDATEYQAVFGYIFGYTKSSISCTISGATYQYKSGLTYYHYYIPASLKKVTITGENIIPSAFYNCSSLTRVVISDSVTSIGNSAFKDCTKLTSVTIGDSVTSIGSSAFSGCTKLTSVTIPDSVTSIGSSAFSGCTKLTSMVIPDSVTSIGSSAFEDCPIETATMPAIAISYIPQGKLKTVVITSGTSIGKYAFEDCSSLTSVTIPDSVTSIGSSAFEYCSSLTSITVGENNTAYQSIDGNVYSKDGKTLIQYAIGKTATSFTIPNSVTWIGNSAFSGCTSLTRVVIPNSVKTIGDYAFYECTSLTSVTIGNSVTTIGNYAFNNCSSLTSVTIPDSVTSIGKYAFKNCSKLMGVVIGDSVTSIGSAAFYNCDSLTSVTIPDSVTSMGDYPFKDCDSLTSVVIGDSVTTISFEAFEYCSSLTSVVIGNSVTSIGGSAFKNCSKLTSVVIPDSVTWIGTYAFSGCSSLTSVTIPDSVTSIGNYAFENCFSLMSITLMDTSTWYITTSPSNWRNKTGGTSISVTHSPTIAAYFKSTYNDYYWYKL